MAVMFDTTRLSAVNRARAMSTFLDAQIATPMIFIPDDTDGSLQLRASTVTFGAADVVNVSGSRIRALRGPDQISALPEPAISMVQVRKGTAIARQGTGGAARSFGASANLLLLDLTEPVEISCSHGFETLAIQVSFDDLGMSAEAVRSAAHTHPSGTTTSGLLARHMTRLASHAGANAANTAGHLLGEIAIDLLRSVIAEAAASKIERCDVIDQTLGTRVQQYILAHLGDATLTPEQIAREHFISPRQLYYLWSDQGENLSEWIIQHRLDEAHRALTSNDDIPVFQVARSSGFVNTSHFNRRYRQRFGESPRDTQAGPTGQPPAN
jgi:AraC-like DNA-binding protein